MKLTNTKTKKSNKGMTLIELTVVILVLLSLISVLFIGARAWMRGSDRANAALLIRNAQQGVRSHTNILGQDTPDRGQAAVTYVPVAAGDTLQTNVFGPGAFVETPAAGQVPVHPASNRGGVAFVPGGTYEDIPAVGSLYMTSDTDPEFYAPPNLQQV